MNTIITEQDFINEIQNDLNSNSILIFADFLEENGEGNRSDFLRNTIQFQNLPEKYCNFEIYKNYLWKTIKDCNLTENQFKLFAIQNAELVLPIFERQFPNDNQPRNAIEVAKSSKNKNELRKAAHDVANAYSATAYNAVSAAYNAVSAAYAANAAYSAARSAAYAANAANAAYSAADAAYYSAYAVDFANKENFKTWQYIRIMEYKLFDSNELVSLFHKPEI